MSKECPTCNRKDFKSRRGMKFHHTVVHGERITDDIYVCNICNDEFEGHPGNTNKYCSRECMKESFKGEFSGERFKSENHIGEDHPTWKKRIKRKCSFCNEFFTIRETEHKKYCSRECSSKDRRVGRESRECICGNDFIVRITSNKKFCCYRCSVKAKENKEVRKCKHCNEEFYQIPSIDQYFCSNSCSGKYNRGPLEEVDNPYHTQLWFKKRSEALKRDNYTCQICGIDKKKMNREPDVHHINPLKQFDSHKNAHKQENLISLCKSCHRKVETGNIKIEQGDI